MPEELYCQVKVDRSIDIYLMNNCWVIIEGCDKKMAKTIFCYTPNKFRDTPN